MTSLVTYGLRQDESRVFFRNLELFEFLEGFNRALKKFLINFKGLGIGLNRPGSYEIFAFNG